MADIENVKTGLFEMLQRDTWKDIDPDRERFQPILNDALKLLKEQQEKIGELIKEASGYAELLIKNGIIKDGEQE